MTNNVMYALKEVGLLVFIIGSTCTGAIANRKFKQTMNESGHDKVLREYFNNVNQLKDETSSYRFLDNSSRK